MKNRKVLLLLAALLLTTVAVRAQSISRQINDIKRDSCYLSAEATMESMERAAEVAEELLARQIEEYVASVPALRTAPNIVVNDVASQAERLQMNRGQMVRVFVYVKKADISAANNTRVLVRPANTTPAAAPLPAPPSGGAVTPASKTIEAPSGAVGGATPSGAVGRASVITDLLACANATEATQRLQRLQAQHRVKRYGNPDSCRQPDTAYWLILDADGHVAAILSPVSGGQRTNMRTNQADSLANYGQQRAIWFTLR